MNYETTIQYYDIKRLMYQFCGFILIDIDSTEIDVAGIFF